MQRYFGGESDLSPEQKELDEAWRKKPTPRNFQFLPYFDNGPEQKLIPILWTWLADQSTSAESLVAADGLLAEKSIGQGGGNSVDLVESHLIRLLAAPDLEHVHEARAKTILDLHRASRDTYFTKDVRASFWIRSRASELTQKRMVFVDRLLATDNVSGAGSTQDQIKTKYSDLKKPADTISGAYRLRDEMLHQIPRIAETLLSDIDAFADEERDGDSAKLVHRTTDALQCLRASLKLDDAGEEPTRRENIIEIERRVKTAKDLFAKLQERLSNRADKLRNAGSIDEINLRRAAALLSGSAVNDAARRDVIRKRMVDIVKKLPDYFADRIDADAMDVADQAGAENQQNDTGDHPGLRSGGGQHPWVHWIERTRGSECDSPQAATSTSESLVQQGEQIRQWLIELKEADYQTVRETPSKRSGKGDRLAAVRSEVERLDTRLRSKSCLMSGRDEKIEIAMSDRFALDAQLFMMVHARRCFQEFWCEAREGEPVFFASAARRLLEPAIFDEMGKERILDGEDLKGLLIESKDATDDQQTLLASPIRAFSGATVNRFAGKPIACELPAPKALPAGDASVTGGTKSLRVNLQRLRDESSGISIDVPRDLSDSENVLTLKTFFRGLRREKEIRFDEPPPAKTVVFELPRYDAPAVMVETENKEFEHTILILDCSKTMDKGGADDTNGRGPDGPDTICSNDSRR